jgi:hypothetical protein
MQRSSAFLIPLGFGLGVLGAAIATSGLYAGLLMLVLAAAVPVAVMLCLAVAGVGWRRWRGRCLRPRAAGGEVFAWLTGTLAAVVFAVWIYGTSEARPPSSKAQADASALVSAISTYSRATGRLPERLADLTRPVVAASGREVGPFMSSVPSPPRGWLPYRYEPHSNGTFIVHTRAVDGEVRILGPRGH